MKKRPSPLAVPGIAMTLLAASAFCFPAEAQTTAKIPSFVLKDGGGEVVGKVIGFQGFGAVSIAMEDPDFDNDVPILVTMPSTDFRLEGAFGRVYYTEVSCGGDVYLTQPSTVTRPITRWLNKIYEVGREPGGTDLVVFRGSNTLASPQPAMIKTQWLNGACSASSGIAPFVDAEEIINITTQFGDPGTWTLE